MYDIDMMDGWHGDEDECRGFCGFCNECLDRMERKGDQNYERSRYEYEQDYG